eukprot:CAMPEP_0117670868 /NCGR_PEP_ID=MMETSP0804-20121206/13011_1 /TAXON_ID=1074897 /ORGANISM="Tetraselmis astigmatica, Strain CCMP880" /LENGTH=635 /DNA_ID=CAMNT_0005479253 /DNA_START=203 /DNA_END=2110 /DNA_ORIENTATION=-
MAYGIGQQQQQQPPGLLGVDDAGPSCPFAPENAREYLCSADERHWEAGPSAREHGGYVGNCSGTWNFPAGEACGEDVEQSSGRAAAGCILGVEFIENVGPAGRAPQLSCELKDSYSSSATALGSTQDTGQESSNFFCSMHQEASLCIRSACAVRLNLRIDEALVREFNFKLSGHDLPASDPPLVSSSAAKSEDRRADEASVNREKIAKPVFRIKASNMFAHSLEIGSWQVHSKQLADLSVKFYYAKKKVIWEVLEGSRKKKIEFLWSSISSMRMDLKGDDFDAWEVELNRQPSFYDELDPKPRKHTLWKICEDFTNQEATLHQLHRVLIHKDQGFHSHFQKLLSYDPRLAQMMAEDDGQDATSPTVHPCPQSPAPQSSPATHSHRPGLAAKAPARQGSGNRSSPSELPPTHHPKANSRGLTFDYRTVEGAPRELHSWSPTAAAHPGPPPVASSFACEDWQCQQPCSTTGQYELLGGFRSSLPPRMRLSSSAPAPESTSASFGSDNSHMCEVSACRIGGELPVGASNKAAPSKELGLHPRQLLTDDQSFKRMCTAAKEDQPSWLPRQGHFNPHDNMASVFTAVLPGANCNHPYASLSTDQAQLTFGNRNMVVWQHGIPGSPNTSQASFPQRYSTWM